MAPSKTLSIIIPVFNEIRTIRAALQKVLHHQVGQWKKEIIVIDDGSNDGTPHELARMGEEITIIRHEQNHGQGRALRTGLVSAIGAFILALLSKETAIVWVPGLLLLYEMTNRHLNIRWKTLAAWWVPAALVSGTYVIVHLVAVPEVWRPNAPTLSWAEAIGTRLQAVGLLLMRLVNVMPAPASDAMRVKVVSSAGLVALLVMAVALWYVITRGLRSNGGKAAGMLAIMLAPALNLVPLPRFIAPHYTYFAVVGMAAVIVILARTFSTTRLAKVVLAGVALWIIAMSVVLRGHDWPRREPILLYVTALRRLGRNSEAEAILRKLE